MSERKNRKNDDYADSELWRGVHTSTWSTLDEAIEAADSDQVRWIAATVSGMLTKYFLWSKIEKNSDD